ncbi:hypothetical protein ACVW0Y_002326 [Pseudomonas sp. TE3786]
MIEALDIHIGRSRLLAVLPAQCLGRRISTARAALALPAAAARTEVFHDCASRLWAQQCKWRRKKSDMAAFPVAVWKRDAAAFLQAEEPAPLTSTFVKTLKIYLIDVWPMQIPASADRDWSCPLPRT